MLDSTPTREVWSLRIQEAGETTHPSLRNLRLLPETRAAIVSAVEDYPIPKEAEGIIERVLTTTPVTHLPPPPPPPPLPRGLTGRAAILMGQTLPLLADHRKDHKNHEPGLIVGADMAVVAPKRSLVETC